jgi:23S rRNA pseudouridine1911/1915/1917 synthase
MDIPIIFENEDLLVINKPAGVVVNRAESAKGETVQDWIERKFEIRNLKFENAEEFKSRRGIVHRLDKDTSGLLVIAKNPASFEALKNQFKNRETVKKYLALVHGKVVPEEGTINAPIERNPFNRKHFGVFAGGREAVTEYKRIMNYALPAGRQELRIMRGNEDFSFLEVRPLTGRTHQIRVHMKYINHPVVCDPIYGGRKNYQADKIWCPRLFLHAAYLKISGHEFSCPLPSDLQSALDRLQ